MSEASDNPYGEEPGPIDEARIEKVRRNEEFALLLAKAIQKIEHEDRHTWDSCSDIARKRALKQARACINIIRSHELPEEVSP